MSSQEAFGNNVAYQGTNINPANLDLYAQYNGKAGNAEKLGRAVYASPSDRQGQLQDPAQGYASLESQYQDYLAWLDKYRASDKAHVDYTAAAAAQPGRSSTIVSDSNRLDNNSTLIGRNYGSVMSGA